MARSPNCTGAPLFKGRVDVTITYPDPDETLLETPVALPTSEPAEAQISYTLASGHMPVWSPYELPHILVANAYAGGQNTAGSATTLYYRVRHNGTDIATGSGSVSAGNFWTLNMYKYIAGLALGDTIAISLWVGASGMTWDYKACVVKVSAISPDVSMADLKIVLPNKKRPTLTIGNPFWWSESRVEVCWDGGQIDSNTLGLPKTFTALLWRSGRANVYPRRGLFSAQFGVTNSNVSLSQHTSYRPYYAADTSAPTAISYTPLNLRV